MNRQSFSSIKSEGGETIKQRLSDKAHQIIEEDVVPLVSDDEMKEFDKIIAGREKHL